MASSTTVNTATINSASTELNSLLRTLNTYDGTPASRLSLLQCTKNLQAVLEDPYDKMTRFIEDASILAALFVLIRINALKKLPTSRTIAAADLARACEVDTSLITRTMRVLVTNGIAEEAERDIYMHNELSRQFAPTLLGGFTCTLFDNIRAVGELPNHVKMHKYADSLSRATQSPFSFAMGHEGKAYYETLDMDSQQRLLADFALKNSDKNFPILGLFPFQDLETQVKKNLERPFVVDIAGGGGQSSYRYSTTAHLVASSSCRTFQL
ncbi:0b42d806-e139-44f5-bbd5-ada1b2aa24fc [Sclerotinia trifoliorum]|uniref:0b42d806-e139-44f5-bbd5-ada1b2aa24fc n=1 Tax=Sclerotinia trifoliorum TaxID=28548 RepID=A0A8H2ZK80_9HELO|nr:0b42d806-e139-44f5-bbd5-ada1b2aa24fc [Sclerotinia trifoliorum]